jgi:hypothetical protein
LNTKEKKTAKYHGFNSSLTGGAGVGSFPSVSRQQSHLEFTRAQASYHIVLEQVIM